jgi:hypothetical protein
MGRTRIELLSSGDIDMYDDVSAPLNFAIADIRTPDKRDGNFSKTIKVPSTKGNDARFGHIFDLNIGTGTYNPNLKAPCTLYIDDVPQIQGFLQILDIEVDDKNEIVYNVSIKGNVSNMFQELGDSLLSDIDFTAFNHTLTVANQYASWTNDYTDVYCYPLIDYGFDNNINQYLAEHLMPSIFVRAYVDKIFSNAGYRYSSTFFDSAHFKNLIIPATGEGFKYSNSEVESRLFIAGRSGTQNIIPTYAVANPANWNVLQFNTESLDPANAYNTGTYKWTVPYTAYYNLEVDATLNTSGTTIFGGTSSAVLMGLRKTDVTTGQVSIIASVATVVQVSPTTFVGGQSNIFLKAGDTVEAVITNYIASNTLNIQFTGTSSRFLNSLANGTLQENDTVILSNNIPKKIKQKDFLLDIIRMFNLYVEVDKNDSKKLLIETRNDFYSSGTIQDWTYKLDNSKTLEIRPMGDLDFKKFKYSYKDDKDYYNKMYFENYAINYGNREFDIDNDFLKSTNETKVMFSPTPLVAPVGDDRVIPKIWEVDDTNLVKYKPFNVRILYNGGVKSTNFPYTHGGTTVATAVQRNTYLYAGHLDSVSAPTFDLNFGVPNELYYNASIYTNANLFNLYHKKFIDEITDPDSKVVTGYFYLTPYDIFNLDFRDTYYFENQSFRLNKIYDYNPIGEATTKCEFIKIKEGRSFTGANATIFGGFNEGFLSANDLTDNKPIIASTVNTGALRSVGVYGSYNNIGSGLMNSYINGSYNNVHGGNNINLLGSSGNTIYDGLENVTLINTSGTIVTESNSLYVNGYQITSGTIASLSGEWFSVPFSASNFYPDAGTWTVGSGDVITNRYIKLGNTLTWNVYLNSTTTNTNPTQLNIYLPGGYNSNNVTFHNVLVDIAGTSYEDTAITINNNNYATIYRRNGAIFANGSCNVSFSITLEIQ